MTSKLQGIYQCYLGLCRAKGVSAGAVGVVALWAWISGWEAWGVPVDGAARAHVPATQVSFLKVTTLACNIITTMTAWPRLLPLHQVSKANNIQGNNQKCLGYIQGCGVRFQCQSSACSVGSTPLTAWVTQATEGPAWSTHSFLSDFLISTSTESGHRASVQGCQSKNLVKIQLKAKVTVTHCRVFHLSHRHSHQ